MIANLKRTHLILYIPSDAPRRCLPYVWLADGGTIDRRGQEFNLLQIDGTGAALQWRAESDAPGIRANANLDA